VLGKVKDNGDSFRRVGYTGLPPLCLRVGEAGRKSELTGDHLAVSRGLMSNRKDIVVVDSFALRVVLRANEIRATGKDDGFAVNTLASGEVGDDVVGGRIGDLTD